MKNTNFPKFKKTMILSIVFILLLLLVNLFTQDKVFAAQTLNTAEYEDSDLNGTVDRIKLTFDENVTQCTYEAGDWIVNTTGDINIVITGIIAGPCDNTVAYFYLNVTADPGETGGTVAPQIEYQNNGVTGSVQTATGDINVFNHQSVTDKASPLYLSSGTLDNNNDGLVDYIVVNYSESIKDSTVSADDYQASIYDGLLFTDGALSESFASGVPSSGNMTDTPNDNQIFIGVTDGTDTLDSYATRYLLYIKQVGPISDNSSSPNTLSSFTSQHSADLEKPIIKNVKIEDTDANGLIDKITYTWSEVIDTDDSAAPVATDLPVTTLPDGNSADFTGASISDPAGTSAEIVVTSITGQVTKNTSLGSTSISGDLSNKWKDLDANLAISAATLNPTYTDAAAPLILTRVTKDTSTDDGSAGTSDGKLDGVLVTFTEAMDASTVIAGDFVMTTNAGGALTETYSDSTDDTTLFFRVTDAPANNTADLLKLQITGDIKDFAGVSMAVEGAATAAADGAAPLITATAPATNAFIQTQQISYTLSEAIASGTIIFTRTSGTADAGSPHTCSLQGTALDPGAHTNLTLATGANACTSWATSLVDGAVYTVDFDATDAASNDATQVKNTNITYDLTAPTVSTVTVTDMDSSNTINAGDKIVITFSEAMNTATVRTDSEAHLDADLGLSGGHTFDSTAVAWSPGDTVLTVTLGATPTVVNNDIINPADTVTDKAGNPDVSTDNTISFIGVLGSTSVILTNWIAGGAGNVVIKFKTINLIPANGKIKVTFPTVPRVGGTDFNLAGVTSATCDTMNGTISFDVSGAPDIILTRGGLATPVPAGAHSCTINNVVNPNTAKSSGDFKFYTMTNTGAPIESNETADIVTLLPHLLTGTSVSLPDYHAGQTPVTATVGFTTTTNIPIDGKIKVEFPAGFDVSGVSSGTCMPMDGTCAATIPPRYEMVSSIARQLDGKIVAAGFGIVEGNGNIAVARYYANGTLDTSFGTGGIVTTDISGVDDRGSALAIQSDSKIVVGGRSKNGADNDFAVVRYNTNGTLDTNFSGDGKVTTHIGGTNETIYALAIQSGGKIVAAGHSYNGGFPDFAVVRYNTDGSLDTSFGSDGKVTTAVGSGNDVAYSVAIQADGKIVAAGYTYNGSNNDFAVVRYKGDGSLDTDFDTDGIVTTPIGSANDLSTSVAIQSNGNIVAGGYSHNGADWDFAAVRYNANGSLDTSFDGDGKVTTAVGTGDDQGRSVAIQRDGKIVAAGYTYNGSNNDFALVRYNGTDGSLDSLFGTGGKVTTPIGSHKDEGNFIAVQSDDKIVLGGYSALDAGSTEADFALVRYNNTNGSLDTGFGTGGKVTTDVAKPTVILTRTGASTPASGAQTCTIVDIKNPTVSGATQAFGITTMDSSIIPLDRNNNVAGVTILPGALTGTDVEPATFGKGDVGDVTVSFTTVNPVPKDGKIVVVFPSGFALSSGGTTAVTAGGTYNGTAYTSVGIVGQTLTLTGNSSGTGIAALGSVSITLSKIKNPITAGPTGTYSISTTNNTGTVIDQKTNVASDTISGLRSPSVTLSNTIVNQLTNLRVSFTIAQAIPAEGQILVTVPAQIGIAGVNGQVATSLTGIGGTLTASVLGQVITFTRDAGTQVAADTAISFTVAGGMNGPIAGATGTFTIQTKTSGGIMVLDEDNAVPGVILTQPAPPPQPTTQITGGGGGGGGGTPSINPPSDSDTQTSSVSTTFSQAVNTEVTYSRPLQVSSNIITNNAVEQTKTVQLTGDAGTITFMPNKESSISVSIPADTVLTSSSSWDGKIEPPLLYSVTKVSSTGGVVEDSDHKILRENVVAVVKIGSSKTTLNFSNSVTLEIPVEGLEDGAKVAIYSSPDGIKWVYEGEGTVTDGRVVFETDHFTYFVLEKEGETLHVAAPAEIVSKTMAFIDIAHHWAKTYIEDLASKGIVSGKTSRTFAPDDNITRAELTKIAIEALFDSETIDTCLEDNIDSEWTYVFFPDVSVNTWYAKYVCVAKTEGIVSGIDGQFKPNDYITRGATLKILLESAKFTDISENFSKNYLANATWTYAFFPDALISDWYAKYVAYAKDKNIIGGYADNTFRPNNPITRAEVAKIVTKILDLVK